MRFLTPTEKLDLIRGWEGHLRSMPPDIPESGLGGKGYPDPLMIPWCEMINALPGICTDQSCCGHRFADDHITDGQLWLRLDEPTARQFDERAFELATHPGISGVCKRYAEWGAEIHDITFAGHGHGKQRFNDSMAVVVEFLRSLCSAAPGSDRKRAESSL